MTDYEHPYNALPQDHRLEEYELMRVLGMGGFGITYLGFDDGLNKPFAIKEYLPSDLAIRTADLLVVPKNRTVRDDFQWGLDRFLREAQTLARFDHRHIVKVHRYFREHGTAYIVMEYVEGETLAAYLARKGTLSEAELKRVLYPLLDGLAVVHEAGILHRDIKPGNIVIRDEDDAPVLIDFGAASQAIGERSRSLLAMLTPGYAPIEQYSGQGHQGPWMDLYALGAVCYRALTGRVPDVAPDRVQPDPLVPVSQHCAGQASRRFLSAVDWALSVHREDRPQSIEAWREALEVQEAPSPPSPLPEQQTKPLKPRTGKGGARARGRRRKSGPQNKPLKSRLKRLAVGLSIVVLGFIALDLVGDKMSEEKQPVPGGAGETTPESGGAGTAPAGSGGARTAPAEQEESQEELDRRAERERRREERQPGRRFKDCATCPELVVVPTGSFMMGSPSSEKGRDSDEDPQHRVRIAQPLAVGVYEVTFAEWDACVSAGGCNGYKPDDRGWGRGQNPVIYVSWNDAQAYVKWLSSTTGKRYRLLSEAEWEYVARAGTKTPFHFGTTISTDQANYNRHYGAQTVEAGLFPSNEYGLYDVHGNVDEWVQDCWNDSYLGAPTDGSAWTSGDCSGRVLRGGSWDSEHRNVRLADRDWIPTNYRSIRTGFRVVRTF